MEIMEWSAVLSFVLSQWLLWLPLLVYLMWRKIMSPYKYFSDRGMDFKKPWPIFGNFGALTLHRETLLDFIINSYNEFKDKRFFGLYDFSRPLLVIRDPELIRLITVKDFDHFVDHRPIFANGNAEPLFSKSLFMLTGQKWRDMRSTLSPAFTGSKMRQMFQLVADCSEEATTILVSEAKASDKPYVPEMKDLFTRFTNDVVATCAFGIQVNSLKDRDNHFYTTTKATMNFGTLKMFAKFLIMSLLPKLAIAMRIRMIDQRYADFFHDIVHDTIDHREKNGIIRPDMINLLIEARKGVLKNDGSMSTSLVADDAGFATVNEGRTDALNGMKKNQWDDDDVTAQCFVFFLAGFDTSATLLCFAAHEIMENPAVQRKLIEELDDAKKQLGGKPMTYDFLPKLKYLDMVISETLRKWPPAAFMDRQCQKTYHMTDDKGNFVTIEKGDAVWIPTVAIHHDSQYYVDPDRFDPERFSDERKGEIQPFTYIPFGSGPRNCIGSRFALMECKAFLFALLTNFTFEIAETSTVPLVLAPASFTLKPKNGFNIHLKPRF